MARVVRGAIRQQSQSSKLLDDRYDLEEAFTLRQIDDIVPLRYWQRSMAAAVLIARRRCEILRW